MWDQQFQSWRLMIAMVPQSKNTPPIFYHVTWKVDNYGKWRTLSSPPHTALFRDLRSRNPMSETLHIQLHGSDFAKLPLSAGLRWLIEFPPEWAWFLSWFPGQIPEHFKDYSRIPVQSAPSMSASSSTAASSTSLTTPGSTAVFPTPSQPVEQVAGTTSKAPSMATAATAATNEPTFDRPPTCPAPPVPNQPATSAPQVAKMTSSSPACTATSSGSALVSLPTPIAQPPMPSWQSVCISNPIPLEQLREFLAQDVEQNLPVPEERSTLPQAVAHRMTQQQQTDHIRDRTWHQSEMERRRRMAQPGWKSAMEAQQTVLIQQQERVCQVLSSSSTPPTTPGMHPLSLIPEMQSPAEQVTEQPVQPAMPTSSASDPEWDEWRDFQESASSIN